MLDFQYLAAVNLNDDYQKLIFFLNYFWNKNEPFLNEKQKFLNWNCFLLHILGRIRFYKVCSKKPKWSSFSNSFIVFYSSVDLFFVFLFIN